MKLVLFKLLLATCIHVESAPISDIIEHGQVETVPEHENTLPVTTIEINNMNPLVVSDPKLLDPTLPQLLPPETKFVDIKPVNQKPVASDSSLPINNFGPDVNNFGVSKIDQDEISVLEQSTITDPVSILQSGDFSSFPDAETMVVRYVSGRPGKVTTSMVQKAIDFLLEFFKAYKLKAQSIKTSDRKSLDQKIGEFLGKIFKNFIRNIIFPYSLQVDPSQVEAMNSDLPTLQVEKFQTSDNVNLEVGFVKSKTDGQKRTVILFHGSDEGMTSMSKTAKYYSKKADVNVILISGRGFGESDANLLRSEQGMFLDTEAAIKYAVSKVPGSNPATDFVVHGYSLGASNAALANKYFGTRMVIDRGFTSMDTHIGNIGSQKLALSPKFYQGVGESVIPTGQSIKGHQNSEFQLTDFVTDGLDVLGQIKANPDNAFVLASEAVKDDQMGRYFQDFTKAAKYGQIQNLHTDHFNRDPLPAGFLLLSEGVTSNSFLNFIKNS